MEGFSEYNFQITFHTFTVELFPVKKIVLLSDTHGYIDQKIKDYVAKADEVWHAGDIGKASVLDVLASVKPLRAVATVILTVIKSVNKLLKYSALIVKVLMY